jgi:SAM-dependent methyltransferase
VDRDAEAIAALPSGIERRVADLEQGAWPLADAGRFDAVVVTNYLHRPLWPHLLDALAPGGVLVYETFAAGNETVGKPSRPISAASGRIARGDAHDACAWSVTRMARSMAPYGVRTAHMCGARSAGWRGWHCAAALPIAHLKRGRRCQRGGAFTRYAR